jgi:glycerol-3-phosphate acyltransferase PlsY
LVSSFGLLVALVIGSYALGCVVGAYYLVRWRTGNDLREVGSGNAGARNASRVLGRTGFIASLLIDAGKGALATWIGLRVGTQPLAVVLAMMAVVIGHIWPAQLGFRGGKGAATALGIVLVFDWTVAVAPLAVGALMLIVTRRFTISGLVAIALSPVAAAWQGHGALEVSGLAIIAVMILYAHRSNMLPQHTTRGEAPPVLHQEPTR